MSDKFSPEALAILEDISKSDHQFIDPKKPKWATLDKGHEIFSEKSGQFTEKAMQFLLERILMRRVLRMVVSPNVQEDREAG